MNHVYKTLFNRTTGLMVAVAETARAAGKAGTIVSAASLVLLALPSAYAEDQALTASKIKGSDNITVKNANGEVTLSLKENITLKSGLTIQGSGGNMNKLLLGVDVLKFTDNNNSAKTDSTRIETSGIGFSDTAGSSKAGSTWITKDGIGFLKLDGSNQKFDTSKISIQSTGIDAANTNIKNVKSGLNNKTSLSDIKNLKTDSTYKGMAANIEDLATLAAAVESAQQSFGGEITIGNSSDNSTVLIKDKGNKEAVKITATDTAGGTITVKDKDQKQTTKITGDAIEAIGSNAQIKTTLNSGGITVKNNQGNAQYGADGIKFTDQNNSQKTHSVKITSDALGFAQEDGAFAKGAKVYIEPDKITAPIFESQQWNGSATLDSQKLEVKGTDNGSTLNSGGLSVKAQNNNKIQVGADGVKFASANDSARMDTVILREDKIGFNDGAGGVKKDSAILTKEGLGFADANGKTLEAASPSIKRSGIDGGGKALSNILGISKATDTTLEAMAKYTQLQAVNGKDLGALAKVAQGELTKSNNMIKVNEQKIKTSESKIAASEAKIAANQTKITASEAKISTNTQTINTVKTDVKGIKDQGIALFHANDGTKVNQSSPASGKYATTIGVKANASGENALAIGKGARASAANTIAIGTGNVVEGKNSGAFGDPSTITATAEGSYSIGNNNVITSNNTFVLGNNVNHAGMDAEGKAKAAGETVANSVYLGNQTIATKGAASGTQNRKADGTAGTTTSAGDTGTVASVEIAGVNYSGFAGAKASGVVTVGAAEKERRLQNLAAGEISATSTDAINGSQLFSIANGIDSRLRQDMQRMDKRLSAGIASAGAIEAAPVLPGRWSYGVGASHFNGEAAVGISLRRTAQNGDWSINGGVALGTQNSPLVRFGVAGALD